MPSTLRGGRGGENVRTSELCSGARRCSAEAARELGAGAHAELGVDVREVARDRALAEEQGGGDLPVRLPLGDEDGDTLLGGGQPFLPRAPADPSELVARPRAPARGADLLERVERRRDCVARRALLPFAAADDAEREQRAAASEDVAGGL